MGGGAMMIGAAEVEQARQAGAVLVVPPGTIVTASARVRAAELGIPITTVNDRPGPATGDIPQRVEQTDVEEATFREIDPNEAAPEPSWYQRNRVQEAPRQDEPRRPFAARPDAASGDPRRVDPFSDRPRRPDAARAGFAQSFRPDRQAVDDDGPTWFERRRGSAAASPPPAPEPEPENTGPTWFERRKAGAAAPPTDRTAPAPPAEQARPWQRPAEPRRPVDEVDRRTQPWSRSTSSTGSTPSKPRPDTGDLMETLAAFTVNTATADVPGPVIDHAAVLLLDALACGHAGIQAEGMDALWTTMSRYANPKGARVIGSRTRLAAPDAALVNGALIHSLEYDPVHEGSLCHPMAGIVPAVLAFAETTRRSGRDVLAALAIATEVICRIGLASGGVPHAYRCGALAAFGAAAVGARLLGLSEQQARSAFGIAAGHGAPGWQAHEEGSAAHGHLPGYGARDGVLAASIAAAGGDGPWQALEGPSGYFVTHEGGRWDRTRATNGLGTTWVMLDAGLKPYPTGRLTHGAIAAALDLRRSHRIQPEAIRSILVETGEIVAARTGRQPEGLSSMVHQRLSVPYTVAKAISGGAVGLADFGGAPGPEVQRLVSLTRVQGDPALPPEAVQPVRLTIDLTNGERLVQTVQELPGGRTLPLTREERHAKVRECFASGRQPVNRRPETLIAAVEGLAAATRLERFLGAVAP